jgi:hypothetical protein
MNPAALRGTLGAGYLQNRWADAKCGGTVPARP